MTAPTTVKVTITPEAAVRAAELGIRAEVDRVIEHARETLPGLRLLEVTVREPYDMGEETGIRIDAFRDVPYLPRDPVEKQWELWVISTFPPQVLEHLSALLHNGTGYAG